MAETSEYPLPVVREVPLRLGDECRQVQISRRAGGRHQVGATAHLFFAWICCRVFVSLLPAHSCTTPR
jgi:hypothetical protein